MSKVTRSKLKSLTYILLQETNKINRKFFQILNDFFRTHSSASRAFVTKKRFSACWGKLPNPLRTLPSASSCASVPDALTAIPAKENAGVNHHPGFKKHLLVLAASTLFVVLVYTLFPVCAQRGTVPFATLGFFERIFLAISHVSWSMMASCVHINTGCPVLGVHIKTHSG